MKDLRKVSYVLRIQIIQEGKKKLLTLSQVSYIDNVLARLRCKIPRKVFGPTDMELTSSRTSLIRHPKNK